MRNLIVPLLCLSLVACGAQGVPWGNYRSDLKDRIDLAASGRDCTTLRSYLTATTSQYETNRGHDHDALISYINEQMDKAGCA